MEKKKVLLLVNSTSGTKNAVGQLYEMIRILSQNNCLVTTYPVIPELGLVSENLADFDEQYDVIACCGGDGTLNHLVNAMMNTGRKCPIGYIPTGSTNDFSRSMNQGRALTLEEQCLAIAGDNTFAYDIGKINETYFNYIAAFGAFTKVSYDTPQKWKNVLGYGAYVLNLISTIPEGINFRRRLKFEYDGGIGEGDFIFVSVSNTTSVAGVKAALVRNSELNDGLFEVVLVSVPNSVADLNLIVQNMSSGNTDDKHVIKFRTSAVRFESDEDLIWTLDGEEYNTGKTAVIQNCKQAMKLCVVQ